jgi:hypothetical protein
MRRVALLATSIASVFGTAAPAAPAKVDMSPATQRDVRCFMLFAAAVNDAQKANNDKMREATGLGVMFYFGKLATEAPGLNIVDAVLQEGSWMEGNPAVKDVGATCDAEFKNSSQRLIDIGQKLKAAGSQSSH